MYSATTEKKVNSAILKKEHDHFFTLTSTGRQKDVGEWSFSVLVAVRILAAIYGSERVGGTTFGSNEGTCRSGYVETE